ncbi:22105_t:CDS:2, partial [Gigaspora rosea]
LIKEETCLECHEEVGKTIYQKKREENTEDLIASAFFANWCYRLSVYDPKLKEGPNAPDRRNFSAVIPDCPACEDCFDYCSDLRVKRAVLGLYPVWCGNAS